MIEYLRVQADSGLLQAKAQSWLAEHRPRPVPPQDWTDDEWRRLLRERPPDTPAAEAGLLVCRWRGEAAARDAGLIGRPM